MPPASALSVPTPTNAGPEALPSCSERDREALEAIAEAVAADGDRFVDALYAGFFARCPEARPLFGEHALSEQEEMVSETFRAIVAWLDDEPWLAENLIAFGESHVEYGVEEAMYPPFVDAFVETVCTCSGEAETSAGALLLRESLEQITGAMATRSPIQRRKGS